MPESLREKLESLADDTCETLPVFLIAARITLEAAKEEMCSVAGRPDWVEVKEIDALLDELEEE